MRDEVELSARIPLKSSDDLEACIGRNTLSSSPEKENKRERERVSVSVRVTSDQVRYKSACVAAVGSVPLYQCVGSNNVLFTIRWPKAEYNQN